MTPEQALRIALVALCRIGGMPSGDNAAGQLAVDMADVAADALADIGARPFGSINAELLAAAEAVLAMPNDRAWERLRNAVERARAR